MKFGTFLLRLIFPLLFTYYLAATSTMTMAAEKIEVTEIDNGACWVTENHLAGVWRIASFNGAKRTYYLSKSILNSYHKHLIHELKTLGLLNFGGSSYDVWLNCSSAGSKIILEFGNSNPKLCAYYQTETSRGIELFKKMEIFSNHGTENDKSGPCYGEALETLLVFARKSISPGKVVNHLLTQYKKYVNNTLVGGDGAGGFMIKVNLDLAYRFKEDEVKTLLEKDAELMKLVSGIYYDQVVIHAGENMVLMDNFFPGF